MPFKLLFSHESYFAHREDLRDARSVSLPIKSIEATLVQLEQFDRKPYPYGAMKQL